MAAKMLEMETQIRSYLLSKSPFTLTCLLSLSLHPEKLIVSRSIFRHRKMRLPFTWTFAWKWGSVPEFSRVFCIAYIQSNSRERVLSRQF